MEPVFSSPSEFDERPAPKAREDCSIVDPVTREEVAKAIANSEDSAPGSGGIILEEMKLVASLCRSHFITCGYCWVIHPSGSLMGTK